MKEMISVSDVPNGAIVRFPFSVYEYMKVGDGKGNCGVVRLFFGEYIAECDLVRSGLSTMCKVAYNDLDEMYRD